MGVSDWWMMERRGARILSRRRERGVARGVLGVVHLVGNVETMMVDRDGVMRTWVSLREVRCRFSSVSIPFRQHPISRLTDYSLTAPRWQGARTRQPVRGSPTKSDLSDYSTRLEPPILLSTPSPPSQSSSATLGDDRGVFGKLSAGFGMLTGLGLATMASSTGKEMEREDEEKMMLNQEYQSPLGKNGAPLRLSSSRQKEFLPPSPPRPTSSPRGRTSPDEMGRDMMRREEEGERKPLSLADRKARGMTNSSFGTLGQSVFLSISLFVRDTDARCVQTSRKSSQLELYLRSLNGFLLLRRSLQIRIRVANPFLRFLHPSA